MCCVYLLSFIHLAYILICHHISGAWFDIVRNRLYDECAYATLLRPPCPINIHTVGARKRPLNARVVLLHECAKLQFSDCAQSARKRVLGNRKKYTSRIGASIKAARNS